MEGAFDTVAWSSGMAAISLCLELFGAGDHIICSEDLYGGSVRIFQTVGVQRGRSFSFVNTANEKAVEEAITEHTKALYIETPSNLGRVPLYIEAGPGRKILEGVRLISYAESLGGVESLITYPMLQTHGDVPAEVRERLGITETFLRMSVGIEHVEDLIADLEQAFA